MTADVIRKNAHVSCMECKKAGMGAETITKRPHACLFCGKLFKIVITVRPCRSDNGYGMTADVIRKNAHVSCMECKKAGMGAETITKRPHACLFCGKLFKIVITVRPCRSDNGYGMTADVIRKNAHVSCMECKKGRHGSGNHH